MRITFIIFIAFIISSCAPNPSTSKLQELFATERDTFESIAEMLRGDSFCANKVRWNPEEPRLVSISENEICGYVLQEDKWYPSSPGLWLGPFIERDAIGVSKDEMHVITGISEDRLNTYLALMKRVGVMRAALAHTQSMPMDAQPEVSLFIYGHGFMHKGFSIYFVERELPPQEEYIVEDIMNKERLDMKYVPLKGHWYIERLEL